MTISDISFRPVAWGDLAELAALHREAFAWEAWDEQAIAEVFSMRTAAGLAATQVSAAKSVIVGFALYTIVAEDAELLTLAVRRDARRRGIGGALMTEFIAAAAARGARHALLEVAADNPGAQRLYARLGFKNERTRNNYYPRPGNKQVSAYLLRLPFPPVSSSHSSRE